MPRPALLALDDGDSVALAGMLTPKVGTDLRGEAKLALDDMVEHAVLTAYSVKRKRATMQGGSRGDEDWNDRPPINEPGRRRLATASAVSDTAFFTRRPNEGPRNTMPKLIGQSRPKPLLPMEVA